MTPLPAAERAAAAATLAPQLRRLAGDAPRKIVHFDDAPEMLEFVGSRDAARLAACRHLVPRPFPAHQDQAAAARSASAWSRTARPIWPRRSRPTAPTTPPTTSAAASRTARRCATPTRWSCCIRSSACSPWPRTRPPRGSPREFYRNAINVMRGAEAIGGYLGLPEQEAFDIEYWALEEAKLRRHAAAGAAGRPHRADHRRRRRHRPGGGRAAAGRRRLRGAGRPRRRGAGGRRGRSGRAIRPRPRAPDAMDVTDEAAVAAGMAFAAREFGGLDILVANAGIASAAPIEETTLAIWRRNHDVLAEGYFLTSREAFPLLEGVRRRDRVRRLEERAGGHASTPRPTPRPRPPPCTWPGAWRWRARRSASGSTWSIPTR